MIRERQTLYALVQKEPEIVRDPLADAGRQIFFDVGADAADDRDEHDHGERELQERRLAAAEGADDGRVEQSGQAFTLQDVVDDDFQGPRLEHVGQRLAYDCEQRDQQSLPVRPQDASQPQRAGVAR